MTLGHALHALRVRWFVLFAGAVLGLLAAGAVSSVLPTSYTASSGVYLTEMPGAARGNVLPSLLFTERVASYREVAVSSRVLDPVAARLELPGGAAALAGRVTATSPPGSTMVVVTVTGSDPAAAAASANGVADSFVGVLGEIERGPDASAVPQVLASVTDRATAPSEPTSPRTLSNLVLGATAGLVAVAAWVLARAALDTTVRTAADLRAATGAPVLGLLPRPRRRRDKSDTRSEAAASVAAARSVRDHVLLYDPDAARRVLAFVGVSRGDGATTVVHALASAFPTTTRVLIVDADLRRQALTNRLDLAGVPGLTEVLQDGVRSADAVRLVGGIDVLPAGAPIEDPGELLAGPRLAEMLTELRGRYCRILVDTPAIGEVLDAALLAQHADATVLVARAGATTAGAVVDAVATVETTPMVLWASVLTGSPPRRPTAPWRSKAPELSNDLSTRHGGVTESTLGHDVDTVRS